MVGADALHEDFEPLILFLPTRLVEVLGLAIFDEGSTAIEGVVEAARGVAEEIAGAESMI
jgi:hypothetical protein